MPSILFVCSANQCRSPMAEVLFRQRLAKGGEQGNWRVESAGVWATEDAPATSLAREVMRERGLNLDGHRSQPVNARLLREFDLILVMEERHRQALRQGYPDVADRVYLLPEMIGEYHAVDDPAWGALETYLETVRELEDLFDRGFERIIEFVGSAK